MIIQQLGTLAPLVNSTAWRSPCLSMRPPRRQPIAGLRPSFGLCARSFVARQCGNFRAKEAGKATTGAAAREAWSRCVLPDVLTMAWPDEADSETWSSCPLAQLAPICLGWAPLDRGVLHVCLELGPSRRSPPVGKPTVADYPSRTHSWRPSATITNVGRMKRMNMPESTTPPIMLTTNGTRNIRSSLRS